MRRKVLISSLVIVVLAIGALIAYRLFFIRMIRVPTGAMANTIIPGDHLIVSKLFGEVKRGDIVIFRYASQPSIQYVSRVVGLPGETIEARDNIVYINGNPIPEQRVLVKPDYDFDSGVLDELSTEGSGPYRVFCYPLDSKSQLPTAAPGQPSFGVKEPFHIPDNQYFVMGDNRDNSFDSRYQGTVPRELIWGKPTTIYWSSHTDQSQREKIKSERIGKRVS
jgi:signal peptidase I